MTTDRADLDLELDLEAHRRELTGYCYRMLGSGSEAEDAVQETMIRAWRGIDRLEGRGALRSWLYRIATNVCIDMMRGPQRRARPMDLSPAGTAESFLGNAEPEHAWVQPIASARVLPEGGDPAEMAAARSSIRLAFVAALQHLPPKQRAVLILRQVLCWRASEVAELLETTVASVNSALQRARATVDIAQLDDVAVELTEDHTVLLNRYVDAFERYDIDLLVTLLADDAIMSMPPWPLWLVGSDQIAKWYLGQGAACRGSRLIATEASGTPAFGSYKPGEEGTLEAWGVHLIDIAQGRIIGQHSFIGTDLFEELGLPLRLDPVDPAVGG